MTGGPRVGHSTATVPLPRRGRARWFALTLPIWIQAGDALNLLREPGVFRYLVVVSVGAVMFAATRDGKAAPKVDVRGGGLWALRTLALYALVGSLIGRFMFGTQSSALPLALCLCVTLMPLRWPAWSPLRARTAHVWLATSLLALLVAYFVARVLGGFPPESTFVYTHEKAHLVVGAVFAFMLLGRPGIASVCLALATAIYLAYPAATFVLCLAVAVGTLFATAHRRRGQARYWSASAVGIVALFFFSSRFSERWTDLTAAYFDAAGKTNNDVTRLNLLQAAMERIRESPWLGSLFTGETTVPLGFGNALFYDGDLVYEVVPHNDFVELWMLGGVVAFGLVLSWIAQINVAVVRACRVAEADDRRVLRLALIVFNGGLGVAIVNPLLASVGTALIQVAVYLIILNCLAGVARSTESGRSADRRCREDAAIPRARMGPVAT